ncbi:MAG TPA: PP2C family protein-serine/threonine phosphatase [Bryobacteraceae bacterium]|nr:PP2C family protein-serine/threonine phosphatase [Bryobacteraceae bacterium]
MASRLKTFWRRITDGIAIQQLWAEFHAESRASYELYANEVHWTRAEGESRWRRFWRVVRGLFWSMMMKLSPGRRVLFLISLVLLFFPVISVNTGDNQFDTDGLRFFGGIGLLVLLALELSDRVTMKRDLEIAREIQSWLMPAAAPEVPGVDIAFATRPANTVAGDYYDAFFRPAAPEHEERLLLVVADVAGKSVPAALLMATLQASLRTLAALPGSLLELVGRLNQYACAQNLGGRRFTTAFLAEVEPATGRLCYVNAGHNWPVLRHASGAIERLEAGGLPLGITPNAKYECGRTALAAKDLLLIFTDGLVEAENDREEEYGEPRMLGILAGAAGTASDVLKQLMSSLDAFVGLTRQHDDITCLVLRMFEPGTGGIG